MILKRTLHPFNQALIFLILALILAACQDTTQSSTTTESAASNPAPAAESEEPTATVSMLQSAPTPTAAASSEENEEDEKEASSDYPNAQLLVDTDWLAANLDDPAFRIIDMRSPEDYAQGHIPGAVNIPVGAIVSTINDIPFEFDQAEVETTLGQAGLTPDMTAVIYDDLGMMTAARLFWTLEYIGHADARILNGGWNAWIAEEQETMVEPPQVEPVTYTVETDPSKIATADEVVARLDDPEVVLIDARSPQEYTGDLKLAERGGHIPGAVNVVWLELLTGGDTTYAINQDWQAQLQDEDVEIFKPAAEVQASLDALGITPDQEIITYCQTLWRGAHVYFLLRLMGFEDVRGYDGSWAEWGNQSDLPIVTGAEPGSLAEAEAASQAENQQEN